MEKFGKYLATLASLSNFIKIKYNDESGLLEIYGPPD